MKAAAILGLLLAAGAVQAGVAEKVSGRALGTVWSATWVQPAVPLEPAAVTRRVEERLGRLEEIFSTYLPGSELARFNAGGGLDWFPVAPELARVAAACRRLSETTDGAFDVTVEPAVRLWGFGAGPRRTTVPAPEEIAAVRARIDWRALEVRAESPAMRRTRPGVAADFSSMAKGFAADALGEALAALGAPDFFVQIGGDVRTGGKNAAGLPWRAGIERPEPAARALALTVELTGHGLSTSGDYRNFFVAEGRRYSHLIDPRTARPVPGEVAAVSVVRDTCAESSAIATALAVLGVERGLALARAQGVACVFFVRRGDDVATITTPGFDALRR